MDKEKTPLMVIVLGMRRSGTSLITNILSKAGSFVGEESDLMKGTPWNRDGYFERLSVAKVNDFILNLCGGSWDLPPYIPEDERSLVLKELWDCYVHEEKLEDARRILSELGGEDAIKLRDYIKNTLVGITI